MNTPTTPRARLGVLLACAAALALLPAFLAAPAQADPPVNDDITGAIVVSTTPGTWSVDTTEATADPTDGWRVADHSVWFTFTPQARSRVRITTAGSSYNTTLTVFAGPRDSRDPIAMDRNDGPGTSAAIRFRVRAGTHYWIAVSSRSGQVGTAKLTLGRVTEPGMDVTAVRATSGSLSGRLLVTVDVTCQTYSEVSLNGWASQRVGGDRVAYGYSDSYRNLCTPDAPASVTLAFDSQTGWAFQPGGATVTLSGYVWDGIDHARSHLGSMPVEVTAAPLARSAQ